ncbi:MAG: 2-phospho-L-lactate transferase [Chloroflexota bacterium]
MNQQLNIVALAGGVGGAKLAVGLQNALPTNAGLSVIVNTGDDFDHWGLPICPDLDTVLYNLAGINNPEQGWGRANETFAAMETVRRLGGEDWFLLGDQDLGLHIRRRQLLQQGLSLTEVTDIVRRHWDIPTSIYPMSDKPVRTIVHTADEGELPFQEYFVKRRCEPVLTGLSFAGVSDATIPTSVADTLAHADVVVLCPSNPYLSIDPILSVGDMRERLQQTNAPVIAVSPIVGGKAVKGPAAKIMAELGKEISAITVARYFEDFLTGFVLDQQDAGDADTLRTQCPHLRVLVTDTMMTDIESKARLAQEVIAFGLS